VRIAVLICSTRPGALGPELGRWLTDTVAERAGQLDAELTTVRLSDLDLPFLDEEEHPSAGIYAREHTQRWSRLVDAADAFIAVTPEYNFGMPATFKNAVDYLHREWAWKPMGFVSYGNTSAGTRSVQHAKQVITTLRLVPLGATVAVRIGEAVENGRVKPDPARDRAALAMLDELVRLANALRPMRERPAGGPIPLPGAYTRELTPDDAADVTVLQRACWVEEALANDTLAIDALHEGLDEVRAWLSDWSTTGVWRDGRLLGMVRTRPDGTDWHIGRLAVAPDLRGRGLGTTLLRLAERNADPASTRAVLMTGAKSLRNIALYRSQGYEPVPGPGDATAVRLAKQIGTDDQSSAGLT